MSTATDEHVDLDVDLDAEVPCMGLKTYTAHGDGEPATHRARWVCHCGEDGGSWILLGRLCLLRLRGLVILGIVRCDACSCPVHPSELKTRPL